MVLRIATRQSPLALKQAHWVRNALLKHHPGLEIELLGMTTLGDKQLSMSLAKIGGKGLFIKELERALLDGEADIAVHSIKDVPVQLAPGLIIGSICEREDPRDVFISPHGQSLTDLTPGAIIGTSSLRRQCQLHALRPDLRIEPLRGNVNTRLTRLDTQYGLAALVLAAAGMHRLGLADRITHYFDTMQFVPAVGQGALGIECRAEDKINLALLQVLEHPPTRDCILAERALNQRLGGGCQVPIAAHATLQEEQLSLYGLVGTVDGSTMLRAHAQGARQDAEAIGISVANDLLTQGADKILQAIYQQYD